MKVPLFVTGSAAVLAAWLGATYIQAVPVKSYPQLGRGSVPLSAQASPAPAKKAASQIALAQPAADSGSKAFTR